MIRDGWVSLGVVFLAFAIGLQLPKASGEIVQSLWFTVPLMALGGWFLTSRMTTLTRLAVVFSTVLALILFVTRQTGQLQPQDVFMVAIPLTLFAVLGICKNRKMPGIYAIVSSAVVLSLLVSVGVMMWPDLMLVVFVASLLALRSAPLPRARLV